MLTLEEPSKTFDESSDITGSPARRDNKMVAIGLAIILPTIAFIWAWNSAQPPLDNTPLAVLGDVPPFSLIDITGKTITNDDFVGQPWVANFVFTRCSGPCQELSARMRSIQYALREKASAVQLVSISIDPKYDTPAKLGVFAKRYNAEPAMWHFLTGDSQDEIHNLMRHGFMQTVMPASDEEPIQHSNYMVIVDRDGKIRAVRDGMLPASKRLILHDLEKLQAETPSE